MKTGSEIRLYLSKADERRASEFFKRVGSQLTRNKALSIILSAGLEALESSNWTTTLPIRFVVKMDATPLPEDERGGETQFVQEQPRESETPRKRKRAR